MKQETAKDILKWIPAHEVNEDGKMYLEEDVLKAMEQYAEQFAAPSPPSINEEEKTAPVLKKPDAKSLNKS